MHKRIVLVIVNFRQFLGDLIAIKMSMFYKNFNTNTVQTFDVGKIIYFESFYN